MAMLCVCVSVCLCVEAVDTFDEKVREDEEEKSGRGGASALYVCNQSMNDGEMVNTQG